MNFRPVFYLRLLLILLTIFVHPLRAMKKQNSNENNLIKEAKLFETIHNRKSVREYTDEIVSDEAIEIILRAAMAAPTAGNTQPWRFVVIQKRETIDAIADMMKHPTLLYKAPLVIAIFADSSKFYRGIQAEYWIQDCSAAAQNLLLAVEGLRLGAVWLGVHPVEQWKDGLAKILNVPDRYTALNIIAVGHPKGETKAKEKFNQQNIHYETWGKQK